jgi:hypothetical protein
LGSNFNNHQFWKYCENSGSRSDMSQSPTHALTTRWSAQTGWYSMPSRSDCMMQLTPKEASGSRNYPMHCRGFVLNLTSVSEIKP